MLQNKQESRHGCETVCARFNDEPYIRFATIRPDHSRLYYVRGEQHNEKPNQHSSSQTNTIVVCIFLFAVWVLRCWVSVTASACDGLRRNRPGIRGGAARCPLFLFRCPRVYCPASSCDRSSLSACAVSRRCNDILDAMTH